MAKQYNPWTGFLEDASVKTADGLDAPEKNAGYEMKKEGQYFKVYKNGKLISVSSTEEMARREAARHRAASQDEKPTIDNAIRIMDSAKSDAKEVYNILAQALQNSTNPNKVSELISKAQGKLLEMVARAKDSKCKTAIDKSIRSCDVNKAEGFKVYNAYVRNDTLYIEYEDLLYGNGKKKKASFTRNEAKRLLVDPWNTWLGTSKMVTKQFAG